ncbi:MAG: hypothetical protein U0M63_01170 [Alistipes onderdonkii]|mgnify:FL=1|jgi:hypothetical protein|nr:hypothetical protein [Alistipes onderdonkii]MEE0848263.1 hypothetical protein [Alistipes onderdonkii]DAG10338.1 MAG TPA: hypothetical protein [Caudoviricetes sp.]
MAQNSKTGKVQEPFKPAPGDEAYVHVTLEQPNYDKRTGQKLSRPRMQKFGVREYAKVKDQLYKQGYTVELLYMPTAKTLAEAQLPATPTPVTVIRAGEAPAPATKKDDGKPDESAGERQSDKNSEEEQ